VKQEPDVRIQEFSPALLDDYLRFFDNDAFVDNPRGASCYCFFNHAPHESEDWDQRDARRTGRPSLT